jgi:glycosyltransferase involved in cell wall biosynthesis
MPKPILYLDASLILHHGLKTAVGLVRVEHYVAEYIAGTGEVELRYVRWQHDQHRYRLLTPAEAALLDRILFRRYVAEETAGTGPEESAAASPAASPPALTALVPPEASAPLYLRLRRRTVRYAAMHPRAFAQLMATVAAQRLPIRAEHGRARRVATRLVRGALVRTGRGVQRGLALTRWLRWQMLEAGRQLSRPDAAPAEESPTVITPGIAPLAAPTVTEEPDWAPGSILLSMANTWDYLDYGYLDQLVKRRGVRFMAVLYDVIAMEYPHTTPGETFIYHRHWVEIGHSAAHLLAISQHTADTYRRYVAEYNMVSPPVSVAYLPNFLRDRAADIGEEPVPELQGRRFVVYCSTIETRKNHPTLVQAWDRLREVVPPERLPVLVLVGKWGWGTEATRLLIERNWRLAPHLKVMDNLSDAELIWLYRHATFTVFPSLSEGFGLAAAESLSFGTPVVVADAPALIEASEGLMPRIDPLDLPGWVATLRELVEDDAALAALRDKAAAYRGSAYDDFAAEITRAVRHLAEVPA